MNGLFGWLTRRRQKPVATPVDRVPRAEGRWSPGIAGMDDSTRRLLIDIADTASAPYEAEEQQYFAAAARLGADHLTAARARSRAIELVATGKVDRDDLYAVALDLLAE